MKPERIEAGRLSLPRRDAKNGIITVIPIIVKSERLEHYFREHEVQYVDVDGSSVSLMLKDHTIVRVK